MKVQSKGVPPFVITIDPGISGTGIAVWDRTEWRKLSMPFSIKTLHHKISPTESKNWLDRANSIAIQFVKEIDILMPVTTVYCEYPKHFISLAGKVAEQSGTTLKLAFLCGMFGLICSQRNIPFFLVQAGEWNGSLPKAIIKNRVNSRLPEMKKSRHSSHVYDAVGIGLYLKGFLK